MCWWRSSTLFKIIYRSSVVVDLMGFFSLDYLWSIVSSFAKFYQNLFQFVDNRIQRSWALHSSTVWPSLCRGETNPVNCGFNSCGVNETKVGEKGVWRYIKRDIITSRVGGCVRACYTELVDIVQVTFFIFDFKLHMCLCYDEKNLIDFFGQMVTMRLHRKKCIYWLPTLWGDDPFCGALVKGSNDTYMY